MTKSLALAAGILAPFPGRGPFFAMGPVVALVPRFTTKAAEGNNGGWLMGEQANLSCPSGT